MGIIIGEDPIEHDDDESLSEICDSEDSDYDPEFNLKKVTWSRSSRFSVKRKSRFRMMKETEGAEEVLDVDVPELGDKDKKSFEAVQKTIQVGQVQKLKVDQCKIYLRKYGLRLTGNKEILIQRVKEHLETVKETEEGGEEVLDVDVPELGEEDKKSFEAVQKIIQVGEVDTLKMEQCKVYLRKYGLRLTGTKDTLIQRIKEHQEILNGGGETKYPVYTFVLNCKGDACKGDVVLFEQNVYEMFSIVSRSASGPPCGTRITAGRIVKESYGAAKQQHTFTIEVLWSKGMKPLPTLHPLLIKGRNLYRLKTMRQKWEDEGERQKIISEKHGRGTLARSSREVRIQEKQMRKMLRANRVLKMENSKRKEECNNINTDDIQEAFCSKPNTSAPSGHIPTGRFEQKHNHYSTHVPIISMSTIPSSGQFYYKDQGENIKPVHLQYLPHRQQNLTSAPFSSSSFQIQNHGQSYNCLKFQSRRPFKDMNCKYARETSSFHRPNSEPDGNSFQKKQIFGQKQLCKFFAQGRCLYGDRCKYLHEFREKLSNY